MPRVRSKKAKKARRPAHPGWPADYFTKVVGAWKGKPLRRPTQGEYEMRTPLDPPESSVDDGDKPTSRNSRRFPAADEAVHRLKLSFVRADPRGRAARRSDANVVAP